nr:hypothetical protein HK105_001109 [Polyrhizophydium stewartii]
MQPASSAAAASIPARRASTLQPDGDQPGPRGPLGVTAPKHPAATASAAAASAPASLRLAELSSSVVSAASASAPRASKAEQLLQSFYAKTAQAIVQSRISPLPAPSAQGTRPRKPNKWVCLSAACRQAYRPTAARSCATVGRLLGPLLGPPERSCVSLSS